MLRSLLIIPILYRFRNVIHDYTPFVFPEGCRPNVSDPSTFETNYTLSDIVIETVLNDTLANDTRWEELIYFNERKKMTTPWEDMIRFGLGEP
jgi:hypothetical protein